MKCFRLRCCVNNSFLMFHQGTKHSKTIKHSRFALVFHTVFSCLDPLMKHSNSLFTYNINADRDNDGDCDNDGNCDDDDCDRVVMVGTIALRATITMLTPSITHFGDTTADQNPRWPLPIN